MADPSDPKVFLVGAGPGSPGLLTLRAVEVLATADIVLYDQLVSKRLLEFAPASAELICVRELPGSQPDKYPHIHTLLLEAAAKGKIVVRLKGGDPLVFGRGGEEAETLQRAGVPYEIVPGVTAALAAAAYLDIPLTHRNYCSAVALVTGHELPTKPGSKLDWKALAAFPGTLAIYMGMARLPLIVAELLRFGRDPDSPAAVVERASTGDMRSVSSRLVDLDQARRNAGLEAPGLILVGEVVGRRITPSWFEARPLFGKRVVVTRPDHQADEMVRRLEQLGAVAYRLPTVEIRDPTDTEAVSTALGRMRDGGFDWVVFSSANGVRKFLGRLKASGRDVRDFGGVKLAAVGPKTAAALNEFHLNADVVPGRQFSADQLAQQLTGLAAGGQVLVVRGSRSQEHLRDELSRTATVTEVIVYEQADNIDLKSEVFGALRRGEVGYVTLTSSNIARNFLAGCDDTIRGRIDRGETRLVAISDETASVVRALGFPTAVAAEATTKGLIDELVRLSQSRPADPPGD